MEKIGKLRHELRTENMISSESSTYQIIEVVNALVDAHNELLETHTVKEAFNCEMCPKEPHDHGDDRNIYLRPTTLEKDNCPYGTQTCRYNGNLCSLCRNEEPTTPETKVKISCPDCPHEETDTPEKKPSERIKELEKRLKKDQPNPMDDLVKYSIYCANMKVRAVINYLDELHSKGKL